MSKGNLLIVILIIFCFSCKKDEIEYEWKLLEVTATAYNSIANQTDSTPFITAYGDSLIPGKKYIAISRDLFKLGIKHNTPIIIKDFDGIYLVKDKMNKRWKKRIDIYMGNDVKAAKEWGIKKVIIAYGLEKDE